MMKVLFFTVLVLPSFSFGQINWIQKGANIDGIISDAQFGAAVSLSGNGNILAVGSPMRDNVNQDDGSVKIYNWDGSNWQQLGGEIIGLACSGRFGHAIDLSHDGNTLIIGASYCSNGYCAIVEWNGTNWQQKGNTLTGDILGEDFGYDVSISGDGNTVAIGSFTTPGIVKIYDWSGTTWFLQETITEPSNYGTFGSSISLSEDGNRIAVGCYNCNSAYGNIRVYERLGSNWSQFGGTINGQTLGVYFGKKVDISGNGNVVAATSSDGFSGPGYIAAFNWDVSGWTQKGTNILPPSLIYDGPSCALNYEGDVLAIGFDNNDEIARVYNWELTDWSIVGNDIAYSGIYDSYGSFGKSVDIDSSGITVAIGIRGAGTNPSGGWYLPLAGMTQVFNQCNASFSNISSFTCDEYIAPDGTVYDSSGIYTCIIPNYNGCDSIITLDVTIGSNIVIDQQMACDSFTWIDGNTYTSNNNSATWSLTNQFGCDSTINLDLTIENSSITTLTHEACEVYTWSANGQTYTQSGTYSAVLTNAYGCDSTVTLNLTMNQNTTSTETVSACESYTWNTTGQTYSQSGNYSTVLSNMFGCDSTVNLDLTIHSTSTGIDVLGSCLPYTWIDGNTYFSSNNAATWTLTNASGCDSLVTLDLTIAPYVTGIDQQSSCDSLVWLDGNTYFSNNNSATYTYVGGSFQGCDSVVQLNYVLNSDSDTTIYISALDSFAVNGITYYTSGSYQQDLSNIHGCDSTIYLELNIQSTELYEYSLEKLYVYPNPTYDKFFISGLKEMKNIELLVLDNTGRILKNYESISISEMQNGISIKELSKGQYFVRLLIDDKTVSFKLSKSN